MSSVCRKCLCKKKTERKNSTCHHKSRDHLAVQTLPPAHFNSVCRSLLYYLIFPEFMHMPDGAGSELWSTSPRIMCAGVPFGYSTKILRIEHCVLCACRKETGPSSKNVTQPGPPCMLRITAVTHDILFYPLVSVLFGNTNRRVFCIKKNTCKT